MFLRHVFNGVYDKVQSVVDREKALGRLHDVPDVEAYRQVAEQLQQQGKILTEQQNNPSSKPSVPKTKAQDPAVVQQKRKAAAGTRKNAGKTDSASANYLNMTDDEFMKLADV